MEATRSLAVVAAATLLIAGLAGCSTATKVTAGSTQPVTPTTEASQSVPATTPSAATTPASASSTPTAKKPASSAATAEQSSNDNGKHFGYVQKVFTSGGDIRITIDYALFLTGKAAQQAAKAHHAVVENDYYVVNDNPMLRTFRLGSSATIGYQETGGSSSLTWISPNAFEAKWAAPAGTAVRYNGYWIWLDKGVVTKMSEQFVP